MTDFVAGSIAGCAGQLVGHPLDSIKVRLQSESLLKGGRSRRSRTSTTAYQSARILYHEGGFRAFFRGLSLPLASKSLEQCIAFGVKSTVDDILERMHFNDGIFRTGLSGAVAGATTALMLTPVYLVKVQLQVTPKKGIGSLNGPIDAIKYTINEFGVRGLYTGSLPIFLGTSIGYSFRFATYEKATDQMETLGFGRVGSTIIGGGLAGMATWASHYPLDLVASRMEAAVTLGKDKHMSMRSHIHEIYAQLGIFGFFRGIGPCLLRAFPVNAVIFLTYDLAKQLGV